MIHTSIGPDNDEDDDTKGATFEKDIGDLYGLDEDD